MTSPRHHESANEFEVHRGDEVVTRDGAALGIIEQTAPDAIHVTGDGDGGDEFWLNLAFVLRTEGRRVVMEFEADRADDYKLKEPAATAPSPRLDAEADTFETEEERYRRREMMEYGRHSSN